MWPAPAEPEADIRRDRNSLVVRDDLEQRAGTRRVGRVVKRQCRAMLAPATGIGLPSILLLEVGAVGEDDLGEPSRAFGDEHGSAPSVPGQYRQVAGVVEVCVCEDNRVNVSPVHCRHSPVSLAQ